MNSAEFLAMTINNAFPYNDFHKSLEKERISPETLKKYLTKSSFSDMIFDMCNRLMYGQRSIVQECGFILEKDMKKITFSYKTERIGIILTIDKNDYTSVELDIMGPKPVSESVNESTKTSKTKKEKYIYRMRDIVSKKYLSRNSKSTWQQRGAVIDAAIDIQKYRKNMIEICIFPVNEPIAVPLDEFRATYKKELDEQKTAKDKLKNKAKIQELEKTIRTKATELSKLREELENTIRQKMTEFIDIQQQLNNLK